MILFIVSLSFSLIISIHLLFIFSLFFSLLLFLFFSLFLHSSSGNSSLKKKFLLCAQNILLKIFILENFFLSGSLLINPKGFFLSSNVDCQTTSLQTSSSFFFEEKADRI